MSVKARESKNNTGLTFVPMDIGTYPARLVEVIDLGLQEQRPYKGQPKPPKYELMVTYEFVDEFMKDEDGQDMEDKPRWISEFFPLLGMDAERAKSTKRAVALDPTNEHNGDWDMLLGAPAMVTVVHSPKKDGGVWENIEEVKSMRPKDIEKTKELVNEPVLFDLDEPDLEVFNALAQWKQRRIVNGLQFEDKPFSKLVDVEPAKVDKSVPAVTVDATADDHASDEQPF